MNKINQTGLGFTLIEVLLALAIIAISLTALLKSTAQTVRNTARLEDKAISHWVSMQGVTMIQLKLLPLPLNQTITQVTDLLGQKWFWQATVTKTPIPNVERILITTSKNQSGPFQNPLYAFRYSAP